MPETFLIAWRRLASVQLEDEARLWLYATACHVLLNQGRGSRLSRGLRGVGKEGAYPAPVVEYAKAMPSCRWFDVI